MKRITRNRRLTPEEAARYKVIQEQVAEELPELSERHYKRMAALDQLQGLLSQLKVLERQSVNDPLASRG